MEDMYFKYLYMIGKHCCDNCSHRLNEYTCRDMSPNDLAQLRSRFLLVYGEDCWTDDVEDYGLESC